MHATSPIPLALVIASALCLPLLPTLVVANPAETVLVGGQLSSTERDSLLDAASQTRFLSLSGQWQQGDVRLMHSAHWGQSRGEGQGLLQRLGRVDSSSWQLAAGSSVATLWGGIAAAAARGVSAHSGDARAGLYRQPVQSATCQPGSDPERTSDGPGSILAS